MLRHRCARYGLGEGCSEREVTREEKEEHDGDGAEGERDGHCNDEAVSGKESFEVKEAGAKEEEGMKDSTKKDERSRGEVETGFRDTHVPKWKLSLHRLEEEAQNRRSSGQCEEEIAELMIEKWSEDVGTEEELFELFQTVMIIVS